MVLFFKSTATDPSTTIYMGRDKEENEDLIKYAWPQDVWFHVDKLSSAHVYLRMAPDMQWESLSQALLIDCAQLVKANSIEGNKKDNLTIIYTPASNLKVKRVYIEKRENVIVNRMNKTKVETVVDHEQEKQDRLKAESAQKRVEAAKQKKAADELAKQREAEKAARSYDLLSPDEDNYVDEDEEGKKVYGLDDDFM